MAEAAERAGAPGGVIQVIEEPTLPLIDFMMKSPRVNVILATGGSPMVRAAYSSGNPAIGVGPGNAPVLVDSSADVAATAKRVVDRSEARRVGKRGVSRGKTGGWPGT